MPTSCASTVAAPLPVCLFKPCLLHLFVRPKSFLSNAGCHFPCMSATHIHIGVLTGSALSGLFNSVCRIFDARFTQPRVVSNPTVTAQVLSLVGSLLIGRLSGWSNTLSLLLLMPLDCSSFEMRGVEPFDAETCAFCSVCVLLNTVVTSTVSVSQCD